jgi:AcrR family transcriptional regulator
MPRAARISRAQVLDATLAIAAERGLAAVSMRAVAARLGVTPMALYHHVRDKQDLLDGLVERLLAELPTPDPDLPWEERLRALARSLRETAARYPDAFLMLLRRPTMTAGAKRVRDTAYAAIRDAGVSEELVPRIERLLSTFTIGFAASEAAGRFAMHDRSVLDADFEWGLSRLFGAFVAPEASAKRMPKRRRAQTGGREGAREPASASAGQAKPGGARSPRPTVGASDVKGT